MNGQQVGKTVFKIFVSLLTAVIKSINCYSHFKQINFFSQAFLCWNRPFKLYCHFPFNEWIWPTFNLKVLKTLSFINYLWQAKYNLSSLAPVRFKLPTAYCSYTLYHSAMGVSLKSILLNKTSKAFTVWRIRYGSVSTPMETLAWCIWTHLE